MFSCCGCVCILVLLGVALAAGSPVQFLSEKLSRTHESIADVLKLTQSDMVTNPLFSSVIRSINSSCQGREEVHLMNVTLGVYLRIFSSILQPNQDKTPTLLDQLAHSRRSQVESALTALQQMMERLQRHLSRPSPLQQDRNQVLSKLNRIKVDDPLVQRKALAQFKEIYQMASVIGSHRC